jgi:Lon protease-like protein
MVPVFPLPNVVFYPDTVLPLHVFEPRYRAMVEDVTNGDGLLVMALLREGWEQDYLANPEIHPVGTVGRIEHVEELPNGRYNIRLLGLVRAELDEVPTNKIYRMVRVTPRPELEVDENAPDVCEARLSVLASHNCLVREVSGAKNSAVILDDRLSFATAVNQCCSGLPVDAEIRQALLEEDDLVERQRRASRLCDNALSLLLRLKDEGKLHADTHGPN